MEKSTERHFYHHGENADVSATERRDCHWCQIRSFATHKTLPITIVNETGDGATIPSHFRFIDHSIFGPGVSPAEEEFRTGCECLDEESCMYSGCHCLEEMIDSEDEEQHQQPPPGSMDAEDEEFMSWYHSTQVKPAWTKSRGSRAGSRDTPGSNPGVSGVTNTKANVGGRARRKKRFAYHSTGAKAGMLRAYYMQARDPIYECHDGCKCNKDLCPNRVVERGRQVPLQIFRTENNRGWGVKTMAELKRGQFVDCYLGEVINPEEADRRRAHSTIAQRKDVYLFALDKFSDPDSLDPRLAGPALEVDGEFMSGPTRFINHSCDPNLRIFARVGDRADKHIHDLGFFAIRNIAKGEELTFDYVDGLEQMDRNAKDEKMQGEMTRCLCGSAKCRGFLW